MAILKLSLIAALILIFSGCSNSRTQNIQLRNINAKQAHTIRQQKLLIDALKVKLYGQPTQTNTDGRSLPVPRAPKKKIVLKKVEDTNYSSSYMYPQSSQKASTGSQATTSSKPASTMTKEECISMIGEAKFVKYTEMFGSETSSLKRCTILKAIKN